MEALLSASPSPMATLPTGLKATATTCRQNNGFPTISVPLAGVLKLFHKFQPIKSVEKSSPLPSCFKAPISCSMLREMFSHENRLTVQRLSAVGYSDLAQPETLQTVQSMIAKQLSIDESTVTPRTKFADLGADSLDTVEIMMALEEKFGVSIGEGGAENISTVQDAADLIEKVKAGEA